jgi:predicted DNA-binding transcriptional regulator AlpA
MVTSRDHHPLPCRAAVYYGVQGMSSSDITVIAERLDTLTASFANLARLMGARLSRAEVLERLGIHRNTLRTYISDKGFPTPGKDGKWLLAEVLEWEARK